MISILGTEYYTITDLMKEFNKSKPTIYRWINTGKLDWTRCGNKMLFTKKDIESFIRYQKESYSQQ